MTDCCPGCNDRTGTHTVRPGLRLCADCWAVLIRLIREGRRWNATERGGP